MKRGVREAWKRPLGVLVCASAVAAIVLALASCELFNRPPVAGFAISPSTGGTAPFTVNLTSTATDPDNDDLEYSWVYGDASAAGAGRTVSHKYMTAGTFTIVLTVTDAHGATAIAQRQVFVTAAPPAGPTARISASPTSGTAPLVVLFDAAGSSYTEASITEYEWAFGDGTTGSGRTLSHTYSPSGNRTYTVTLTVRAADGTIGTATTQIVVTVTNGGGGGTPVAGAPSARYVANRTTGVAPLQVTFDPEDSEADVGRVLILYTWSYGDGVAESDIGAGVKTHVFTTDDPSQTFSVMLLVVDNENDSDSITKTVKAYNHRPVAGFEVANPPGGDGVGLTQFANLGQITDPNWWVNEDVIVYGNLGSPAGTVKVWIRSKEIPDPRWFGLDGTLPQQTLRTATGLAVSSTTAATPAGYRDHNFSYDPEGQTWAVSPPAWFPNQAWGVRYLYIDWDDSSTLEQVNYVAVGGTTVSHDYTFTADGQSHTITVKAVDWLGQESALFSRDVIFKSGVEGGSEI